MRRRLTLVVPLFVLLAIALAAPAASTAKGRTVVMFVGGLGSSPAGDLANFGPLAIELTSAWGYGPRDLDFFEYGGSFASYTAARTCQPIETTQAELASRLRRIRDSHAADGVVLVGHSNGGVAALGLPGVAPDLAPFVRRIVTVDSPLQGIEAGDALLEGFAVGPCTAADELYARRVDSGWPVYLGQLVGWELDRGIGVYAVANPEDWAVYFDRQQVPGLAVNYLVDVADSGFNHSAALKVAPGSIAPLIGPQGQ